MHKYSCVNISKLMHLSTYYINVHVQCIYMYASSSLDKSVHIHVENLKALKFVGPYSPVIVRDLEGAQWTVYGKRYIVSVIHVHTFSHVNV